MATSEQSQGAKKSARIIWSENDTEHMLRVITDLQVVDKIACARQRNKEIFKRVAHELRQRRICKDWKQIRTKWKTMKQVYYKARRPDGGLPATKVCHYDLLHSMLGHQPLEKENSTDADGITDAYNETSVSESDHHVPTSIEVACELRAPDEVSHILPTFYSYEREEESSDDSYGGGCNKVESKHSVPVNVMPLSDVVIKQEMESTNESTSTEAPNPVRCPDVVPSGLPKKRKRKTEATKQEQALQNYATRHEKLMLDMLERQQRFAEQQIERQRQWEENMLSQFQENFARTTENMMTNFMAGMRSMFTSPVLD